MWALGQNLKDFLKVKFSLGLGTETGYPKPEDAKLDPIKRGRGYCSKSVGNLRAWHDKN